MKTIEVPLDGSAVAEQVLPHVRLLAPILAARVRLIRVVSDEEVAGVLAHAGDLAHELAGRSPFEEVDAQQVGELLRQRATDYLAAHARELRAAGVDVDVVVRDGSPAEQILDVAGHDQVTLVALATHGYSGLRRWALGSVADKVLQAATTPVFLVRAAEPAPASVRSWKRILVPLDGSALAEQALPLAIELATRAQAELLLFHAVSPPIKYVPELTPFHRSPPTIEFPAPGHQQALQQLHGVAERWHLHAISALSVVTSGEPAQEISDTVAQEHVDLIVMATHGYSGVRRWALGSVADKVLHASDTPLLLVRAQPDKAETS